MPAFLSTLCRRSPSHYDFCVGNCQTALLCAAVIKSFGAQIGAEQKQVQGLIRLAKKNGEKLGFLS